MKTLFQKWNSMSLIMGIVIGLVIGTILALTVPKATGIGIAGTLFVTALKSIAPILVLILIMNAICHHEAGEKTNIKNIITLYLVGIFAAGALAVIASYLFPVKLILKEAAKDIAPPSGLTQVLTQLLTNMVSNPIDALINANFLDILV